MCGIAGIVSFDSSLRVTAEHLSRMSAIIAHRGPDGEKIWINGDHTPQVGFAFRRLAVLDPNPRAMQPMTTRDGRYTLVFNGEIYNFRELRAELSPHDWQTTGDAEVLLEALARWSEKALDKLNGMFAIALWDEQEQTLLLARDRMGQKPLYYTTGRGSIAFASEIRALNPWPDWDQEIDETSITEYLRYGHACLPGTLLNGAFQVLPGCWIRFTREQDSWVQMRYYDCNKPIYQTNLSWKSMIEKTVEKQLVSDVPLGVFLSGGIDSSIIAFCARKFGPVKTFSIGFEDPAYDESRYAREVARHLETEHFEFRVTLDAALDLPKLAAVYGDPFADSSALPTHYLARETRKHVTVALSGDGGDELFGGYDRYRAMSYPIRAFAPLAPLGRLLAHGHPKAKLTRLGRLIASSSMKQSTRYRSYLQIFSDDQIALLLGKPCLHDSIWESEWQEYRKSKDAVETALAMDRTRYLPNDLLTKVDRASMLHSLEVRSPFMDHELVSRAAGLFSKDLLAGGGKRVLRHAFSTELPESVFDRPKMGFAVPIGQWFRTSLREMLVDHLLSADSFCQKHFQKPVIDHLIEQHLSSRADHSQRLYSLLMLELSQKS